MDKKNEEYYLSLCLNRIEVVLNRGASDTWVVYDFEKLSDAIYEHTQVRLSVTTLKRVWGRLRYDSTPTHTTLNALAQFAGYVDWRDFVQSESPSDQQKSSAVERPSFRKLRYPIYGLTGVLILVAVVYFSLQAREKRPSFDPDRFEFTADKMMTEGVPNSVIFRYAAHEKPDSLFIVQTWDISRKTLVSSDQHEHSAIYYYPGFFRSKLIADGQIMKTHDLWITSDGWLCLLEDEPIPVYFKKEQYLRDGIVEVDEPMLTPYHDSHSPLRVRFFNQRDLGELMNDNFTFETLLKNDFNDGTNACHYTQVLIQCKDDIIIIPLAAKSCVGNLQLYFCGTNIESKSADLSGFGSDLTQWTSLKVETVDKKATIFVNDKKAYTLTFPHQPTGIVGVQYRFNGAAAVKDTKFTAGGVTYEMD